MDPSYLYNFQKRSKSDRFPRSLDHPPPKPQPQTPTLPSTSQTLPIPSNQILLQFPPAPNNKLLLLPPPPHPKPLKKLRLNQSHNISYAGILAYQQSLNLSLNPPPSPPKQLTPIDRTTCIITMKLEVKSHSKNKSPLKGRTRFLSKSKGNQKEVTTMGAERKTMLDYIRNKQDTFLEKDQYNKVFKLEPMGKKEKEKEEEYVDKTNRRLLHIEKMKPAVRIRDLQRDREEQRRRGNLTEGKISDPLGTKKKKDLTILPHPLPTPTQALSPKTQTASLSPSSKQQPRLKQKQLLLSKRFDPQIYTQYAPLKRGFIGKKDYFIFGLSQRPQDSINKIEMYRDFLWKINFSNGVFVESQVEMEQGYKVYVGKGNNSMLVRGLMKRRFWWVVVDREEEANFSWTQLKKVELFKKQITTEPTNNTNVFRGDKNFNFPEYFGGSSKEQLPPSPSKKPPQQRSRNEKRKLLCNTDSDTDRSSNPIQKPPPPPPPLSSQKTQRSPAPKSPHSKIFNPTQLLLWHKHTQRFPKLQSSLDDKTYLKRSYLLKLKSATKIQSPSSSQTLLITNHFPSNTFIGNKKALFYTMRKYYQLTKQNVFTVLPTTFHISAKGVEDPEYQHFLRIYKEFQDEKEKDKTIRNIWIAKPGEFTNRGTGITVCASLDDIKLRLRGREKNANGTYRTFILQKYIQKPLLYNKRKFDIRHYMLITCINGNFKGYWYQQGYLRTSSYEFSTKNYKDPQIHLTNDAIQKHNESYGKYEKGNKLSYADFQKYLDTTYKNKTYDFFTDMLPKMRSIATNAIRSSYFLIDPEKKQHNFEIFGLDFMIDEAWNPWLIEVNTNPCLELGCPLLARLIPGMVENALKIGLDPLFPPPYVWQAGKRYQLGDDVLGGNRFELVFDEAVEGAGIQEMYRGVEKVDRNMGEIEEKDEEFEEETGKEWDGEL